MAYADQKMSGGKVVAIIIVALIHAVIGYAFVTGLAYKYVKKAAEKMDVFDVEQPPPPPPEEPPPPPPPDQPLPPPPVVSPPPIVANPHPVVQMQTVTTPPPAAPMVPIAAPPAPPAPPPAPAISKAAGVKGNPGSWVTNDAYPPSSVRDQEQGISGLTFEVNAQGRIENCRVSSSSGSATLDRTACSLVTRRGRYSPALNAAGQPVPGGTKTLRFTWKLPE